MASVGQGAAEGLMSGYRMAMDIQANRRAEERDRRNEERQGRMDQRQAGLDQRAQADHDYNRQRQQSADERAVLDRRRKDLAARGTVYQTHYPGDAIADEYADEDEALREDEKNWTVRNSGPRAAEAAKLQAAEKAAVMAGTAPPDVMVRHAAKVARMPARNLMRGPQGEPSVLDTAREDLLSDDPKGRLRAFNVILHSELQEGVGQQGLHGGTIVAKQIENVVPDPNSSQDDPRVIPTLRVWVNNGKAEASGDEVRARRAMAEGAPPGATGYYFAPLTEGRSSDPKAFVKSVSINEQMQRVDKLLQLGEAMNQPEGQAAYQQYSAQREARGGNDPRRRFEQAVSAQGIKEPKTTTTEKIIPRGATLLRTTTDPSGKVLQERVEGNASADTLITVAQDEAAANGTTVAAEYAKLTAKKGRGLASGGGGEGGDGLSTAQDRKFKRQIDTLKEESKDIDEEKRRAREEYAAQLPKTDVLSDPKEKDAAEVKRAELKKDYDARMKDLDGQQKTNRANRAGLQQRLDMEGAVSDARNAGAKAATAAAKGPLVLKFDKSGNRVP